MTAAPGAFVLGHHSRVFLELRQASAEEAATIAALHRSVALEAYRDIFPPEAPAPTPDDVLAQWNGWLGAQAADDRRRCFVIDLDAETIGVILAGPDPTQLDAGHISRLYVSTAHWGKGIGRRLHDAALEHLVASGFDEATLWVLEQNTRARKWYERLGWTCTNERKSVFVPSRIDDVRYRRRLR